MGGVYGTAKKRVGAELIESCFKELVQHRMKPPISLSAEDLTRINELEQEIQKANWMKANTVTLQASIRWMKEGDAPTSFFFQKVKEKKLVDRITGNFFPKGQWIIENDAVADIIVGGLCEICVTC